MFHFNTLPHFQEYFSDIGTMEKNNCSCFVSDIVTFYFWNIPDKKKFCTAKVFVV